MNATKQSMGMLSLLLIFGSASDTSAQDTTENTEVTSRYIEEKSQRGLNETLHEDSLGVVRPDLYLQSMKAFKQIQIGPSAYLGTNVDWQQIGPAPATVNSYLEGNGQMPGPNAAAVIDMVIDPSGGTDQTVYAITNDGGVWKTTDGGIVWSPKTDHLGTLSFGAIALDPNNPQIVYAGTGNIFNNGYFKAIGIYVSTDGGETWNLTAGSSVLSGIGINRIVMPQSGILVVATNQGLFRSINSGASFTRVEIGGRTNDYITDLDIHEGGSTIWASVNGRGIYASTDLGANFGTNLWSAGNGTVPTGSYGFVSLGVSVDGQTMYANAALYPGVGVYKSTNGGSHWIDISAQATRNAPGIPFWKQVNACQCGYDQTLAVDPVDANRVYMGFQDMWLSEDGGENWKDISYSYNNGMPDKEQLHVDFHVTVFSPAPHRGSPSEPTRMWAGNDGGIWSTSNAGESWTNHNADPSAVPKLSFATNLFRGIDTGRGTGNNVYTYGGMQDTGTAAGNSTLQSGGTFPWREWGGGDGGQAAVNWQDPQKAYGMWGNIIYTHDAGASYHWSTVHCPDGPAQSFAELETGPTNGFVYLSGACGNIPTLFESQDDGLNYSVYHQFNGVNGQVRSIGVTPANANTIYVSLSDGTVYRLNKANGEVNATDINIPNAIAGQVPKLAVNQANADWVLAVYAGYSQQVLPSRSKHVYLSWDAGANWRDISGQNPMGYIPDLPIYAGVFDVNSEPNSILVASDFGVLRTYDFGLTWHVAGPDLPNVHTNDLEIDTLVSPSLVKAGTYGRSTWSADLPVGDQVFGQLSPKFYPVGSVKWVNNTNEDLNISWIDQVGRENPYATIPAGAPINTNHMYFTGVSVVRDQAKNVVLPYVVNGSNDQEVVISQAALDRAKANALTGFPGMRSVPGSHQVTNFPVNNHSSQTLDVNWIQPDGETRQMMQLKAGGKASIGPVYFGGTFTFTDTNRKVVGVFTASDARGQSMDINDTLINSW